MIRAFVAMPLPPKLRQTCLRVQDELKRQTRNRVLRPRWTSAEQMHVTVKFLGDVAPEKVESLVALVKDTARGSAKCGSAVRGLDAFPSPKRARVIVLQLEHCPTLVALGSAIEAGTSHLGFAAEKRAFRPHVTVARLGHPANTTGWIADVSVPAESVTLKQLVLFRSELTRTGARYTTLAEASLGKPTD